MQTKKKRLRATATCTYCTPAQKFTSITAMRDHQRIDHKGVFVPPPPPKGKRTPVVAFLKAIARHTRHVVRGADGAEIAAALHLQQMPVYRRVRRLIDEGLVSKAAGGGYVLTEQGVLRTQGVRKR